ncbi:MAG: hypothetical protein CVU64_23750 [Deltaproteobacteria bacterium HGW-Deltaproteobacteria-21]|nr:MAG: hypothetical protein CVU64_23750 [Deltaproteobacteria bacterium HGW-Deltaproteobacteria-21]
MNSAVASFTLLTNRYRVEESSNTYMGKDLTEVRSLQGKLAPDMVGSDKRKPTSLQGIAKKVKAR